MVTLIDPSKKISFSGRFCFVIILVTLLWNSGVAQKNIEKGDKAFEQGDFVVALQFYEKEAKKRPSVETLYNITLCQIALDNYSGCIATANKAIHLDSTYAPAYYSRSRCRYLLGNFREAVDDLTISIRLEPRDFSYFIRGLCKIELDDYQGAVEDFTTSLQLNPDQADVFAERGYCLEQLEDETGALADYSMAIQLADTVAEYYADRADIYFNKNLIHEAKADYLSCLRLDSDYVSSNLSVSEIFLVEGKYDSAFFYAGKATASATDLEEKTVGLFLTCVAGQLRNIDISVQLEALNNKLNQDFVIEYWSFDYLKGLLMNFSIPAEKREFISNLITRMEEKAAYEDEY